MSTNRAMTADTKRLFEAIENGNKDVVDKLLDKPSTDVSWQNEKENDMGPLLFSLYHEYPKIALSLVAAGSDVTYQRTPDSNTALHQAALKGYTQVVEQLLKLKDKVTSQGVDHHDWNMVNARNLYGNTPLHLAAQAGHLDIVNLLLDAGANIRARNGDQSTPLHFACYRDAENEAVISRLIKAGSDVNALDCSDTTPLMVASKKNQAKGAAELLEAGAEPKEEDCHGNEAMYYAKTRKNTDVIKVLLKFILLD